MPTPDVLISPNYRLSDFGGSPHLDQKITVFEDRITGWFLDIAARLVVLDGDHEDFRSQDFAVLAILAVYFEMIAQYHSGRGSNGASQTRFCEGVTLVFPRRFNDPQKRNIYRSLRCALYHNGLTRGAVIGRDHADAFHFENGLVWINPSVLLQEIRGHFARYIMELRDPANTTGRQRFQAIYDANPKL